MKNTNVFLCRWLNDAGGSLRDRIYGVEWWIDYWWLKRKGSGRKQSWHNLHYCYNIFLERFRKTMTTTVRISGVGPVLERVTCRLRRKSDDHRASMAGKKAKKIRIFWTVTPWRLAINFRRFGRAAFSFFSFTPASRTRYPVF